jgi:hypothetical protein
MKTFSLLGCSSGQPFFTWQLFSFFKHRVLPAIQQNPAEEEKIFFEKLKNDRQ